MASETIRTKKAAKTLHRLQSEQGQRARQIGYLRGKLEKRSRQLQTLEAKMAALERSAYGPGPDGRPVAASGKALRPARLIINSASGSFAQQAGSPDELVALLRTHGIQAEVYLKTSTKAVHAWVRRRLSRTSPWSLRSAAMARLRTWRWSWWAAPPCSAFSPPAP